MREIALRAALPPSPASLARWRWRWLERRRRARRRTTTRTCRSTPRSSRQVLKDIGLRDDEPPASIIASARRWWCRRAAICRRRRTAASAAQSGLAERSRRQGAAQASDRGEASRAQRRCRGRRTSTAAAPHELDKRPRRRQRGEPRSRRMPTIGAPDAPGRARLQADLFRRLFAVLRRARTKPRQFTSEPPRDSLTAAAARLPDAVAEPALRHRRPKDDRRPRPRRSRTTRR